MKLDDSGVYLLEATDAHRQAQVILFASPMVLLARGEHGKLDVRALDATTGEPRPDASVILFDTHGKQRLGEATTGPDGLASFPFSEPNITEFLALAQRGATSPLSRSVATPCTPTPAICKARSTPIAPSIAPATKCNSRPLSAASPPALSSCPIKGSPHHGE